ncbi:MAG TPA: hypothetical protein VHY09_12695 [Candidatus Methylacidiphilales bacterium]|nr:hypothetical protein [Candidatus Methylacidiphilales bacterium]
MFTRIFCLSLLLVAALLPSGCAAMDESADDQMNTYHSTPVQSTSDDHGWGTGVSLGGH